MFWLGGQMLVEWRLAVDGNGYWSGFWVPEQREYIFRRTAGRGVERPAGVGGDVREELLPVRAAEDGDGGRDVQVCDVLPRLVDGAGLCRPAVSMLPGWGGL